MSGRNVGRYRIAEKLGEGGMGVVYRAEDLRLGREVALKFLRADVSRDSRLFERFQAEARAASALSHPHICTVHDIDQHEGSHFIVMELLKGATLAERLRNGPFPPDRILNIGIQLADALAAAHAKGILHRDVKPGNIFLTARGEVKLLDFGIAKLQTEVSGSTTSAVGLAIALAHRPGDDLTRPGEIVGTLAYMSPEQVRRGALDARTDVFSLGAVLYELATGRPAFLGTTNAVVVHAIVNDDPAPPSEFASPVPPELEDLILKTLQKRPELRPPTAEDLKADLLRVQRALGRPAEGPARAPGAISSLAVLPLQSLSDDREQRYLADGMTEALIAHLSKIHAVRVIARTSVMTYRNTERSVRQIARELRVGGIIEGSVLRSSDRLRLTARLIRAADESCVWSETYDRELRETLTLQSELAQAIALEIRVALRPEERKRLAQACTVEPEAHAAFLRGRYHINKGTPEGAQAALREFESAVARDPRSAPAWTGVAEAYLSMGCRTLETLHPLLAIPRARAAASRALAIEPIAEAYAVLAHLTWVKDPAEADRLIQQGLAIDPGSPLVHQLYAEHLYSAGRFDDALEHARSALDLDPFSLTLRDTLAWSYHFARRLDEARLVSQQTLELDPGFAPAHLQLGFNLLAVGHPREALEEFVSASRSPGGLTPLAPAMAGHARALLGDVEGARETLRALEEQSRIRPVPPHYIGVVLLGLGEIDRALDCFEEALQGRHSQVYLLGVSPLTDSLREIPRFQELVRRARLPPPPSRLPAPS